MSHKSQEAGAERTIDRGIPVLSGRRSYVLDSTEYEQLIAKGFDPETVAEAELGRRAKCCRDYDDLGQITRITANCRPPKSFTHAKPDR